MCLIKKILISFSIFCLVFNYSFASLYVFNNSSSVETISSPEFSFQSKAQLLMDLDTGYTLYANNENEKIYPASVTKIMTMLLIMEAIDSDKLSLDDKVTCSKNASSLGGSQIWFREGEVLSVHECLKAISVVSANDVCVAMAEHLGGSETNFIKQMNEKAKELGMVNTNFMNCHGLDDENHYTTAYDISIMSRELVNNHNTILNYSSIWMDTLRDGTFGLTNTNKLIRYYDGATGLKTGSTSIARFNLSATATRDNTNLLAIVCTAPSGDIRTQEVRTLLDYGFSNFESTIIKEKQEDICKVKIDKANLDEVYVKNKDRISYLIEKGDKANYTENIIINEDIKAPINSNSVIGKIEYYDEETNDKITESELIIIDDIKRANFKYYLKKIFEL